MFKDHIFVQYNRPDDANKLIKDAQIPLIFKGNKLGKKIFEERSTNISRDYLDVLPAREARSTSTKSSSSTDRTFTKTIHRQASNYEPSRKRFSTHERSNLNSQK